MDETGDLQSINQALFTNNLLQTIGMSGWVWTCFKREPAVSALHARGVAHGDLHGGNVITDGQSVVLIDFENANLLDEPRKDLVIPLYLAPEIFDVCIGAVKPDYRPTAEADLFHVGLIEVGFLRKPTSALRSSLTPLSAF